VLLDGDSRVFNAWGGEVLPSAFVLDRKGRARFVAQGPLDWDRVDIRNALKDLMAESVETSGVHRDP
jgi:predicted transcriptional regulator